MYGLSFKGVHSNQYNVIMKSDDRPLLPNMNKSSLKIPGMVGQVNNRNGYDNRIITISFSFEFNTLEQLQRQKRDIARWIKGSGVLRFDDEQDKYYEAEVLNSISFTQKYGHCYFQVIFECYPCAYGQTRVINNTITTNNKILNLAYNGTYETTQLITLQNIGTNTVKGFKLIIEAEKE